MLKFWGITGPKSAQCTLKWAAAVSRGIPRICHCELQNLANGMAEFGKICRGKLWALVRSHLQHTVFCKFASVLDDSSREKESMSATKITSRMRMKGIIAELHVSFNIVTNVTV